MFRNIKYHNRAIIDGKYTKTTQRQPKKTKKLHVTHQTV